MVVLNILILNHHFFFINKYTLQYNYLSLS